MERAEAEAILDGERETAVRPLLRVGELVEANRRLEAREGLPAAKEFGEAGNHAERGLRGAVIYRKLSLGSQSEQGERTVERLVTRVVRPLSPVRTGSPSSLR